MPTPVRLPHSLPHSWRAENKSEKQPKYVMQAIIIAYRPGPRPRPPKTSPDNRKRRSQSQSPRKKATEAAVAWSGSCRWLKSEEDLHRNVRFSPWLRAPIFSPEPKYLADTLPHAALCQRAHGLRTENWAYSLPSITHPFMPSSPSFTFFSAATICWFNCSVFLSFGNLCLISRRGIFLWIICSHSWALMRRHARFCRNYVACRGWFWNFSFDSTQICQDQWWR